MSSVLVLNSRDPSNGRFSIQAFASSGIDAERSQVWRLSVTDAAT